MIKHADVLAGINSGLPFSIEFVTYDRQRNTGGQLRTLVNATKKHQPVTLKDSIESDATASPRSRKPNHSQHGTINVICADGSLVKVHTRLITKYNQQEVVL